MGIIHISLLISLLFPIFSFYVSFNQKKKGPLAKKNKTNTTWGGKGGLFGPARGRAKLSQAATALWSHEARWGVGGA